MQIEEGGRGISFKRVMQTSSSSMATSDDQANRTNSIAAAINELGAAAQEIARSVGDTSFLSLIHI